MRVDHPQPFDKIFFFQIRGTAAFATALLRAIRGQRLTLDVTCVAQSHDHIFWLNQIFGFQIRL